MKICYWPIVSIFSLIVSGALFAQEDIEQPESFTLPENPEQLDDGTKVALKIDFPIFDFPYQTDIMNAMGYGFFNSYSSLSMSQSVALTMDVYSSMHFGLKKLNDSLDIAPIWKNVIYYGSTAAGIAAFAYLLPFGYPWMKHEYTHSLFSRFGIDSFNSNYRIIGGMGLISITDDDLSHFKANSPADFVRMNSAGMEAYNLFSDLMVRRYFFYDLDDLSFIPAFITVFLNLGQIGVAIVQEGTIINIDDTIKNYYQDDKGQKERYITGHDSINWVYELFRPDEPYVNRGSHPSGDGSVARYITFAQLTDEERAYLELQGWLTYLNFVSPLLYSIKNIPLGDVNGNFALRHYLTSFGMDISAQVFLKKKLFNMAFTLHNYANQLNWFPAIEAELVDFPLAIGKLNMFLSPRILIGMQPKEQKFKTDGPEFLGLFGLRVDFMAHKHIFPYLDFIVKSNGWVAGNEYLDSNASIRLGVSLRF